MASGTTGRGRSASLSALPTQHCPLALTYSQSVVIADRADSKRDLVLPAVVDADPARLIKVAPPLAARAQSRREKNEHRYLGAPLRPEADRFRGAFSDC